MNANIRLLFRYMFLPVRRQGSFQGRFLPDKGEPARGRFGMVEWPVPIGLPVGLTVGLHLFPAARLRRRTPAARYGPPGNTPEKAEAGAARAAPALLHNHYFMTRSPK
ncbi:hypothetical protein DSM19430T_33130 [Desulfovibrio psychrotolerans]|uniref:Uncharacterized protein n=1 Tax=Desulfovibrio psychrotolerans TaxID=415242 RepID=A0A7J0BY56_9BACT|nr:hypothetical protein DSM19430T_33130 [Desulfovibrio psychrotolerans]